jgi:hypothetical protein
VSKLNITISRNGRMYPARRDPAELARTRAIIHQLAHQGLSIREVRKRLVDHHVLRSVGSICADLRDFECDACATTPAAPEPSAGQVRPEVLSWQ